MDTEKKYTEEEIKAIANEEIRKSGLKANKELNLDEMEKVSGGDFIIPEGTTHADIDEKWDIIQTTLDFYGSDVAYLTAQKLGCAPGQGENTAASMFESGRVDKFRGYMHDLLNGTASPFVPKN